MSQTELRSPCFSTNCSIEAFSFFVKGLSCLNYIRSAFIMQYAYIRFVFLRNLYLLSKVLD